MPNNIAQYQFPTRNRQQTELAKMAACSEAHAPDTIVKLSDKRHPILNANFMFWFIRTKVGNKYISVFNLFIDRLLIITDFCWGSNFDIYCAASNINFSCFYVSFVFQFLNLYKMY